MTDIQMNPAPPLDFEQHPALPPSTLPATTQMQNSSLDNLPSLSATSPINDNSSLSSISPQPLPTSNSTTNLLPTPSTKPVQPLPHKPTKPHDAAILTAKRTLRLKVREDWTWPLPPTQSLASLTPDLDAVTEWRERDSDSSYDPSTPLLDANPYRFENPDAVAVAARVGGRKRKRTAKMEEEMGWNEGLKAWVERRDVWAGARVKREAGGGGEGEGATDVDGSAGAEDAIVAAVQTQLPTPPSSSTFTKGDAAAEQKDLTVLVPLPPPLLPATNAVRASIVPATYASIYTKVCVQGATPSVPINLADLTRALVQGWKKDGEWPPKEKGATGRVEGGDPLRGVGRKAVRRSVGRVKRVLGLGRGDVNGDA